MRLSKNETKRKNEDILDSYSREYSVEDYKVLKRLRDNILSAEQNCYNQRNESFLDQLFYIVDGLDSISRLSAEYKQDKINTDFYKKQYLANCSMIKEKIENLQKILDEDLNIPFSDRD